MGFAADNKNKNKYVSSLGDCADRYKLFAHLLSVRAPNTFSFAQTIWHISKQKEGTARAVIWKQFGIQNVYTLESSFCGSDLAGNGNMSGFHFDTRTYLHWCKSCWCFV